MTISSIGGESLMSGGCQAKSLVNLERIRYEMPHMGSSTSNDCKFYLLERWKTKSNRFCRWGVIGWRKMEETEET